MEIKLVDLFLDEDFWEFNIVQYWGKGIIDEGKSLQ